MPRNTFHSPKPGQPSGQTFTIMMLVLIVVVLILGLSSAVSFTGPVAPVAADIALTIAYQNTVSTFLTEQAKAGIPPTTPAPIIIVPPPPPTTPAPIAIVPPPPAGFYFQDNFDTGLNPLWRMDNPGAWTMVNGQLKRQGNGKLMVGDATWSRYAVEFDMFESDAFTLFLGYQGEYDYLEIHFYSDSYSSASFYYSYQGNFSRISGTDVKGSYSFKTEYGVRKARIKAEIDGNFVRLYNWDEQIIEFQVPQGTLSGSVGIENLDYPLDNFKVIRLP